LKFSLFPLELYLYVEFMAHIVIDGYNLIRTSPSLSQVEANNFQAGRNTLIVKLAQYKKLKGHKITVVFDATFTDNLSVEEARVAGIKILFSKGGQTADEIIIEMAREKRGELIVVSSDKEILHTARACGCGIFEAQDFIQRINEAALMEASFEEKEQEIKKPVHKRWITKKKGPSKRLPKAQRRALSKMGEI
jgi:predicted RNA-binding protein with PIN domain